MAWQVKRKLFCWKILCETKFPTGPVVRTLIAVRNLVFIMTSPLIQIYEHNFTKYRICISLHKERHNLCTKTTLFCTIMSTEMFCSALIVAHCLVYTLNHSSEYLFVLALTFNVRKKFTFLVHNLKKKYRFSEVQSSLLGRYTCASILIN